ncbi:MAG: Fic family protein [Oscillospiraceae bacterium]|nr:Fic family protein [Oscillospiraceae bacterium]
MALENKLGLEGFSNFAREEELISKKKAVNLFDLHILSTLEPEKFSSLKIIHKYLFDEIYDFAGEIRTVNISKGNFRFAPLMYLDVAIENIDKMPQSNFYEIVEKYVEMNIAHPFREGNSRSTRIWLDHIFKAKLHKVIDWSLVDKEDYLLVMERSPIREIEIKHILKAALTDEIDIREVYMKGIDHSYYYEGYSTFKAEEL